MSKFRFASMSSISPDSIRSATYAVDPTSPASSAPHHANRMRLRGLRGSLAISSAISISVPVPEPLSLIPGPSSTESRWAPSTIVRSGSPASVSAIRLCWVTFSVVVDTLNVIVTGPACDRVVDLRTHGRARHRHRNRGERLRADLERLLTIRATVVEDQHRSGAERLGQRDLLHEEAVSALDQRDLAGQVDTCPVRRFAAARTGARTARRRNHDVVSSRDLSASQCLIQRTEPRRNHRQPRQCPRCKPCRHAATARDRSAPTSRSRTAPARCHSRRAACGARRRRAKPRNPAWPPHACPRSRLRDAEAPACAEECPPR